jgi:hypothetical protein
MQQAMNPGYEGSGRLTSGLVRNAMRTFPGTPVLVASIAPHPSFSRARRGRSRMAPDACGAKLGALGGATGRRVYR